MPKMAFTDAEVRSLQTKARKAHATGKSDKKEHRYFERQGASRGAISLMLNVSYTGACYWHVLYYRDGRPYTQKLGTFPDMSVAEARAAIKPMSPAKLAASKQAGNFKDVAEQWLDTQVRGRLRTAYEIERHLTQYIYPAWADEKFMDIKRSHVAALLDKIQLKRTKGGRKRPLGGVVQADMVRATLNSLMKWYEDRTDEYVAPTRGVRRRDLREADEKHRERVLTDDEIRMVWAACDDTGTFGAAIRLLLMTGQRLAKVKHMKWADVKDGIWTIATERREKGNAGVLKLPQLALDVIAHQPQVIGCPYVLPANRGKGPFNSFSANKRLFNERVPEVTGWTLHDLRRTARTLMDRIGVKEDVAERVLGHKREKIVRNYNRFDHFDAKADALQRLADHIALILNPPEASNVVPLRG